MRFPDGVVPAPGRSEAQGDDSGAGARRIVFGLLFITTYAALIAAVATICAAGGWTIMDGLILTAFAIAAPWSVLGFWNAAIGLWLLHGVKSGLAAVAGFATVPPAPLTARTALAMTLRNEDARRAMARLAIVRDSLARAGQAQHFDFFVLSDTDDPAAAAQEEEEIARWRAGSPAPVTYRRRETNEGYKAGNLRDFCLRWGHDYTFMITLDADSLMTGETIVQLVRIGEARPRIGILQSLVAGMPAQSAFARIFQFGMRHGMRPYTMGSAWWSADCGPYWGHNALVRIAPFLSLCDLPRAPGKPPLLSHDQVEAVLMRRGGYEVRVLPVETGSYEDNPPTLAEFTRRDLRWCQGNMQYWRLLGLPGLKPVSRLQLAIAILMFLSVPAFTALIALAALKPFDGEAPGVFPAALAIVTYGAFMVMNLAPKLAGYIDIAITPGAPARYGGGLRFALGCITELAFSFLLAAATTFRTTLFMIAMMFGRTIGWRHQERDAHALSFVTAMTMLWPQLVFGIVILAMMARGAPAMIPYALPLTLGYLVAVPFAMLTASPKVGRWLARGRICAIPEEIDMPAEIAAVETLR